MADQHSHEFDCRICGEHFHSEQELDRHNRDEHSQQAGGIGGSTSPSSGSNRGNSNGRGSMDEA